jgi:hypothetical protein
MIQPTKQQNYEFYTAFFKKHANKKELKEYRDFLANASQKDGITFDSGVNSYIAVFFLNYTFNIDLNSMNEYGVFVEKINSI